MKTIDELMEGQEPGSIKIRRSYWVEDIYFIPFFKTKPGTWHGLDEDEYGFYYEGNNEGWILYIPPKRKVKMWQWLVEGTGTPPYTTVEFYPDKQTAQDYYVSNILQKLEHTEIEVETDE